ncbi:MAG TPA: hypothetical protein VFJ82_09365, partial [Longimicrobium sp.]|nr:hypothetical protein [Longimicrobium sp.]
MTHRIHAPALVRRRPPATVPHARPWRAGSFAWAALAQLALALLLGSPAPRPARHAAPRTEPGIRPRDAVEVAFVQRRAPAAAELAPRRTHTPRSRAGSGASPFVAAERWSLAAAFTSTEPVEAAAPDPRGARRPAYYANAPPL